MDNLTKAIIDAWENAGSHPEYHNEMKRKLWREWPVLARVIQNLVDADQIYKKVDN